MQVIWLSWVVINPAQDAHCAVSYLLSAYVSASRTCLHPIPLCRLDLFIWWEDREYFSICVVDIYILSVLFLSPLNSKLLEWVGYCVVPMSRPVCACMQEGSMAQFPFWWTIQLPLSKRLMERALHHQSHCASSMYMYIHLSIDGRVALSLYMDL